MIGISWAKRYVEEQAPAMKGKLEFDSQEDLFSVYARDEAARGRLSAASGKPVRMPDSALTGLSRSDEETKQNSRRDSGFLSVLPAVLRRERIDKVWGACYHTSR